MREALDAMRPDKQGEPVTFDEVAAALTPRLAPGVSRGDLFAALKAAQVTGGRGRPAPDISIGGALKSAFADAIAAQGPRCPGCGAPDGIPHHERCSARREGDAYIPLPADEPVLVPLAASGAPMPEDPFPGDVLAGTGIAEMLKAMTSAGVSLGSAERIIGAMLAAHGIMSKEAGDAAL